MLGNRLKSCAVVLAVSAVFMMAFMVMPKEVHAADGGVMRVKVSSNIPSAVTSLMYYFNDSQQQTGTIYENPNMEEKTFNWASSRYTYPCFYMYYNYDKDNYELERIEYNGETPEDWQGASGNYTKFYNDPLYYGLLWSTNYNSVPGENGIDMIMLFSDIEEKSYMGAFMLDPKEAMDPFDTAQYESYSNIEINFVFKEKMSQDEMDAAAFNEAALALPNASAVTIDNKQDVAAVRAQYAELSDEALEFVDAAALEKLNAAEKVIGLIEQYNQAQTAAASAQAAISQAQSEAASAQAALEQANTDKAAAEEALKKANDDKKAAEDALTKANDEKKAAEDALATLITEKDALEAALQEAQNNVVTTLDKVSIKKAKGAKKKITVTWKKAADAKGYEIIIAKNKACTKDAKTFTVKKGSTVKKVIKKLAKGTYYVKVRAYKAYNGNTLYGAFSAAKKAKVK